MARIYSHLYFLIQRIISAHIHFHGAVKYLQSVR